MAVGGGLVSLVATLLTPVPLHQSTRAIALSAGMVTGGAVLFLVSRHLADRTPSSLTHVGVLVAVGAIGAGAQVTPGADAVVAVLSFYVWVALFAGAFLSWRSSVFYLLLCGAAANTVLGTDDLARIRVSVLLTATVLGTGAVTAYLSHRLQLQALSDPLTGLPNRQSLSLIVDHELARARRTHEPMSLALADLDRFKEVNDTHGHAEGDRLLVNVSKKWRDALRSSDFLVRYGGDEFVVVLPGCEGVAAAQVVGRMRQTGGWPCSIGLVTATANEDANSLIGRADAAMYLMKTKRAGEGRADRRAVTTP
jgi:diguanylate cyclase (GGDEF)-like protein